MTSAPPTPGPRLRGSRRGSPQVRLRVGFVMIAMVLSVFGARLVQLQGSTRVVRRDGGRRGHRRGRYCRRARRHPGPQRQPLADSIDGLMVVADPMMTEEEAPEIARFLCQQARRRLLHHAQPAAREGQPVRVHRSPRPVDTGHRGRRGGQGSRVRRALHPSRPGARLSRARHRREHRRLRRHGPRLRRSRARSSTRSCRARTAARSTRSALATGSAR